MGWKKESVEGNHHYHPSGMHLGHHKALLKEFPVTEEKTRRATYELIQTQILLQDHLTFETMPSDTPTPTIGG
jgi:hypothetical protein